MHYSTVIIQILIVTSIIVITKAANEWTMMEQKINRYWVLAPQQIILDCAQINSLFLSDFSAST